MVKIKKRLTHAEEFQILTLVMDKVLWFAFGITAFGFYNIATNGAADFVKGIGFMVAGVILFAIFVMILVKEYEIIK
jgi:hypothetical protein